MVRSVYVAAGGGGDAIAAYALHAARWPDVRPVIATFAWDRLLIDPVPGPRTAGDFDQLTVIDSLNSAFTPQTRPKPPAGSTLPRLSGELDANFVLLDPQRGAVGLREQLRSLVRTADADRVDIVDVGGDILAAGHERRLRSPLADALALAGCAEQTVPVQVHVTGAGMDGELPATTVLDYVHQLGGSHVQRLSAGDARLIMPVLDWHLSEVTALTAAAAQGLRGTVEIRDRGYLVQLDDASSDVFAVDHARVLKHSATATAMMQSSSFEAAEQAVRLVCGRSELDHERRKARRRQGAPGSPRPLDELIATVEQYCIDARSRGVDYLTFRRLAEVADLTAVDGATLRQALIATRPERYVPPLWSARSIVVVI